MIPRKLMYEVDKEKLLMHFTNDIRNEDRYLRFGIALNEYAIEKYLENSLHKFGLYNMWFVVEKNEKFIGTVHVNLNDVGVAEMGFTVSPEYRNNGIAQHLFYRASTWAAMKGAKTIYTHCLSQNKVMQHIAKKNGMSIITLDQGEREATIKVTKGIVRSFYEDTTMDNVVFVDSAIKKQQELLNSFLPH